jgi:hypothetical protein
LPNGSPDRWTGQKNELPDLSEFISTYLWLTEKRIWPLKKRITADKDETD